MTMTVSARIGGGFALLLLLLAGLLITGMTAIGRISDSLQIISEETTPLVIASGQAQESLLQARLAVNRYYLQDNPDELAGVEAVYEQQKTRNQQAFNQALLVSRDLGDISTQLQQVQQATDGIFQRTPEILSAHKLDVTLQQSLLEKRRLFTDMSDEIESNILDLQASAAARYQPALENLYDQVMGTATLAVQVLDRPQRMAVLSAQKTVQRRLARIEEQLQSLSSDLPGNATLAAVVAAFNRFKAQVDGEQSFLALYVRQLQAREAAHDQLAELDVVMETVVGQLDQVVSAAQLAAGQRADAVQTTVANSRVLLLTFFAVALAAAIVASVYIVRSIRLPLRQVVEFLGAMAQGDVRYDIDINRGDELGDLARSTNTLAGRLREALLEIHANAESLAASSVKSSSLATAGDGNAKRQLEHTKQFAVSMNEMATTVREVAASASNTLEQVRDATTQTSNGQEVVNDNIRSINALESEIERAAQVIAKLNERSNNISEVLEVIRNIANQTNLLALNAAIEAARAGEQGRGFAVVADEVRTLASRTQMSTTEIQEMIERLQLEAREAVSVMDESQREAGISVEKARLAGESLEKITVSMQGISLMNAQIASAAEEQSMVSREMQNNIEEISSMAESTAQASKQGLDASSEVAQLAESLKGMVAQFKLQG